ncbi:MAG: DUF4910 domain-containing protein [Chromatiaceae bacterium]|nr:DUF4910 domain-containing protein [Chromatiaceae bacterium]MCP5407977.1 DUF4910 domain-containing protein [Chromatiaceae bacterium]MCP5442876.1 DUF4910 domain-containing protein [Chromatiaceae bacterium]
MSSGLPDFEVDEQVLGKQLFDCITDLFPICRSITGDGVRETLARLARVVPLTTHEVPSGTPVFDWTVPDEWNIRDAYVKNARGERVIDFRRSNLHVVNYSVPFRGRMSLEELRPHLFTLPEQPDRVPYRTSYYQRNWGFCLSQNQLDALAEGEYEVCIDSSLQPGCLTYGELTIPGGSTEEVLVSAHICHPSLANDNLSGAVIAAHAARRLQSLSLRLSYRFLFIPATIGSIAWLSANEARVPGIRYGLVLACLGDPGPLTYKRSRRSDAKIDQAAIHVLQQLGEHEVLEFSPYGYDERQFCSPGFDLPVGRLSRTPHGRFPEYHTSADNLEFIQPAQLAKSLSACLEIFEVIEKDRICLNRKPNCEPQLSKYGLYDPIGGVAESPEFRMAILWVLNLSDGRHSLLDIAERSGLRFRQIALAADALSEHGLLENVQ